VAIVASVVGDLAGYGIGRMLGQQFLDKRGQWIGYTPARRAHVDALFNRWGLLTIFITRTFVGLTASPRGVWARGRAGIGLSFWRGRASGVRSPFSRKEIPNVTVAYADDRRHEAGGFIAGNASHLH
jgi:hypothetical protein